jgi:hypothetical protein
MTLVDWLLTAGFTVVIALLANSLFPPNGWIPGAVIALGLLFLAKRRRDKLKTQVKDDPEKLK